MKRKECAYCNGKGYYTRHGVVCAVCRGSGEEVPDKESARSTPEPKPPKPTPQ